MIAMFIIKTILKGTNKAFLGCPRRREKSTNQRQFCLPRQNGLATDTGLRCIFPKDYYGPVEPDNFNSSSTSRVSEIGSSTLSYISVTLS